MAAAPNNKYSQKWTPELIEELCNELLDFALEDRTVHFVEFARRKKKMQCWINAMAEDYPEFAEAYRTAKELLASKLVKSSIYGDPNNPNFNGTHAMTWKSVYSKTFQDYEKWKAEISRDQPKEAQNQCAFNQWKEEQKSDIIKNQCGES